MTIGIIGAGHIGSALTRRLQKLGHKVRLANSRGPETLSALVEETGATAVTAEEAVRGADIIVVTIPERAIPDLPKSLFADVAAGIPVVDTGNYYPKRDGRIAAIERGTTESRWVADQLGRSVIKAFNNIYAQHIVDKGLEPNTPGRIALPIAGDDHAAKKTIMDLVEQLGFDAVDAGTLDESWRQQPGSPVYGTDFDAAGVRRALAQASRHAHSGLDRVAVFSVTFIHRTSGRSPCSMAGMQALYSLPISVVLVVMLVVAVGVACGGQLLLHRANRGDSFVEHNDVAGFIIAVIGMMYAVVLGFITVICWQSFDTTNERVWLEAASVVDAWHDAVGLPPATRTAVRQDMLRYANEEASDEWKRMRTGEFTPVGDELIMHATTAIGTAHITNLSESNAQAATLRLLSDLHDDRQRRLAANSHGLSPFEWLVLVVGAMTVISMCWLFGVTNQGAHLVMTGAVAVVIALMFALIFELQYPFRSDLGITNEAWTGVIEHVHMMDGAPEPAMQMGAAER